MNPVARRDGLVVRELPGELIVYDPERHEAHCLNATAAAVFRVADGRRSPAQIARHVAATVEPGADEALVALALEQLVAARLVEEGEVSVGTGGVSRRDVMRRVGLGAAVLLPLITSALAPSPAEAAATCVTNCSSQPNGTPCSCYGACPVTTETCIGGFCSDGGGC